MYLSSEILNKHTATLKPSSVSSFSSFKLFFIVRRSHVNTKYYMNMTFVSLVTVLKCVLFEIPYPKNCK